MNKSLMLGLVLSGLAFGSAVRASQRITQDGFDLSITKSNNKDVIKHVEHTESVFGDDVATMVTFPYVAVIGAVIGARLTQSVYGLALGTLLGGWVGFNMGDSGLRDAGPPAGNPWQLVKRMYAYLVYHRHCDTICKKAQN